MSSKYIFINKTLFFPEEGILVIGDLHIGYDFMLRQSGILIPERQIKEIITNLKKIMKEIEKKGYSIKKIVFLGDIKHSFGFEFQERDEFLEVLDFLRSQVSEENIIFIKGNHDTIDHTSEKTMKPYHIEGEIFFTHGHKTFPEMFDKKIKFIVTGHIHPSIILSERPGVKTEEFKCFLTGSYKGKTFIVLPSFLGFVEGTPVNDYKEYYIESFFVIPRKEILKFKVHIIGKDKIYDFGEVGRL